MKIGSLFFLSFIMIIPSILMAQNELPLARNYIYGKTKDDCPFSLFTDAAKIGDFRKGETLKIIDNSGSFFKIMTNERIVFSQKRYFYNPDSLDAVFRRENHKVDSLNAEILRLRKKADDENIAANSLRQRMEDAKQLKGIYSAEDIRRWVYKKIEIGMSSGIVKSIKGTPKKVNKTTTKYGVSEQWVYDSEYYYFKNGKLTAFQENSD